MIMRLDREKKKLLELYKQEIAASFPYEYQQKVMDLVESAFLSGMKLVYDAVLPPHPKNKKRKKC